MNASVVEPARDERGAVEKAISLLVALGDCTDCGLGVTELAKRAQLTKSTAFRVLQLFARSGVVERCDSGYRLGDKLSQVGQTAYSPEHERLRDLLMPFLGDLYESTRQTVQLAVLHKTEVLYLAKMYGHQSAEVPSRIGGRLPAHSTAVGKALLAYTPAVAEDVLRGPLTALTAHTVTDPGLLTVELENIRRTGCAFDDQGSRLGLCCLAVPIFDNRRRAIAGLSVSGVRGRVDRGLFERTLRQISAAASRTVARSQLPHSA